MKKNYFITLLCTLCFVGFSFGQGSESFANSNATTSYADNNFTGDGGITWTYIQSRDANGDNNGSGINLPALMLRRVASGSKVTSSTISGGIGDFSVKLYKGFTGGGDRQVELFVNGISKGTSTPFDDFDEHIFSVSNINVAGDIIIELVNITSKQVIVDDITWTAPGSDPSIVITSPSDGSTIAATTSVDVMVSVTNFNVAASGTGDGYIKWSINGTPQTDKTDTNDETITVAPGNSYTIAMELVDNSGMSLTPAVTSSTAFTVNNPCDLALGTITTTCDALTSGTDTYNGSIAFTGGNTGATYTITAPGATIGGDNPNSDASGTITFSGITEGTDVAVTIVGTTGSSCDYERTLYSPTCVPAPICPAAGSLIVTEIMQNPSAVLDNVGEYFEVYNTSSSPIDILGWTIKSLTTSSKDHIISTSLIVSPNGYVVLGVNADSGSNGGVPVDYQYTSNFYLGNSSDSIVLECGSNIIDSVSWDNGATFPDPNGKSMELATDKYDATDNDTGSNWAEATTEITSGGDFGTPGAENVFTLSVVRNYIEGFSAYPNPITNKSFTVKTSNSSNKEVTIFNVLGKKVFSTTFSGVQKTVNIATLNSGIYILKVIEDGKSSTKKLVIK